MGDTGRMGDVSVRPALPADAPAIGTIHAATMRLAVEAGAVIIISACLAVLRPGGEAGPSAERNADQAADRAD